MVFPKSEELLYVPLAVREYSISRVVVMATVTVPRGVTLRTVRIADRQDWSKGHWA